MKDGVAIVASMIVLVVVGVGIGWSFGTTVPQSTQGSNPSASAEPYSLSVVETMGNLWNSSAGLQPKYLLMGSHGFQSSGNIFLPAHRLVQLTISSYDTPDPESTAQEGKVAGTVGGVVYLINGTLASNSNASAFSTTNWGQNVTSVPAVALAHTFTISQLGINIPVVGGSTVIAYIYLDKPGTYTWLCLTPCGLGADGMSGAMSTSGWMTGTVTIR